MRNRTGTKGAALLLAAAVSALGAARPAAAVEPGRRVEVRLGAMRFDYEERDPAGRFLDGETGFVPALTGELELRGERGFVRGLLRYADGTVDYDGHAQGNADVDFLPVKTESGASFLEGEVQAGALLGPTRSVALFGALAARRWGRDIRDATIVGRSGNPTRILGLTETYGWFELQAGLRWTLLDAPRAAWDVEARVVRTAGAEMELDLDRLGGRGGLTFSLEPRTGWRLGSTYRHHLGPRAFLSAGAQVERYEFGASAPVDVGGGQLFYEPDSETLNVLLELGAGVRF